MRGGKNAVIRSRLNIFSFLIVFLKSYSISQFHQSLDAGPDVFVCRCCMPWCEGWIPLFSSQPTAREGDCLFNQVYLVHICDTKSASTSIPERFNGN